MRLVRVELAKGCKNEGLAFANNYDNRYFKMDVTIFIAVFQIFGKTQQIEKYS